VRLLGITDLHDQRTALARILSDAGPADVILLGGDLTNFGRPSDAERLVHAVQSGGAAVLAVAGNCDSAEIDRRLVELGVSLHARGVIYGAVGFHGLSGMPPWRTGMYQFTEEELAASLQAGYAQIAGAPVHVVLAHPPPRNDSIDCTYRGQHVGSTALRTFIDQHQPDLVVCGHIHEGRGIAELGRTIVVNCGAAASGSYALVELGPPVRVELRQL
jgi:uncharacterized protein